MTSSTDRAPTAQPSMGATTASEWRVATLGDCVVMNDASYSPQEAWPFINYLDTSNVTQGRVAEIQSLVIGKDKVPSRARRKVKLGDVVYSTVRPNQRHFGLIKHMPENFLASTGFAVIRGQPDVVHTEFIYWFLAQDNIVEYLQTIAENSTSAYPSIRPSDLEELEIFLPPLSEQRRIAEILGALDDKIELNRRTNETLEQMARALFKSWFVDFDPVRAKMDGRKPHLPPETWDLFPDEFVNSELGMIPRGWEVRALAEFATVVYGAAFASKRFNDSGQGLPIIRIRDLSSHNPSVFTDEEHPKGQLMQPGDIVVGMDGEFRAHIWKGPPSWLNQRVCNFQPFKGIPRQFLFEALISPLADFERSKVGTTVIHLGKTDIDSIRLARPPAEVFDVFASWTDPIIQQVATNAAESRLLVAQRDAILPKLVSGELRDPVLLKPAWNKHDIGRYSSTVPDDPHTGSNFSWVVPHRAAGSCR